MKPHFWLTVVFLMSQIGLIEAAGQCRAGDTSVYGMFFKGHTFKTVEAGNPAVCMMRCEEEVRCQSYNFVIGRNICELNDRTKEARPEDFKPDDQRLYMRRTFNRERLGSIQDLPAESCSEIKASEGNNMATSEYWIYSDGEAGQAILARCDDVWQKINIDPLCFGARNNSYGAFNMTKTGSVKTMKLVYKSGSIRCNQNGDSYWGCYNNPKYANKSLTIITNTNMTALLPTIEDLEKLTNFCHGKKHFYKVEGIGHKSPELVFRNLPRPLSLSRGQELQVWYGQDWGDCSEHNNSGATCVDVYAWYI